MLVGGMGHRSMDHIGDCKDIPQLHARRCSFYGANCMNNAQRLLICQEGDT
jgi:hypothetical protein